MAICGVLAWCAVRAPDALAISIELKDVAPDRIERQRAFVEGRLPLPGTPDTKRLAERLAEKGLKSGLPVLLRIFKEDSELELWMEKDGAYVHFATYPICHWSGTLGPKMREGDRQTPEGFYAIARRQLHHEGRWPQSINLGFPNAFDRAHSRDGSYILMHGGCSSVGCFAMTNAVIGEVYGLARAALAGEQRFLPVHVFPFRMTDERIASRASNEWSGFWRDLKQGYDSFERTRRPPVVSVCEGRYQVEDAAPKPAAEENSDDKKVRTRSVAGAVREGCPEPVVATVSNRAGAQSEFMSKLGGPRGDGVAQGTAGGPDTKSAAPSPGRDASAR
jgi:murein L,D-transpeptidase YafK